MSATELPLKERLLDAILPHVAFDGWSETALAAATEDLGISNEELRAACPRGAIELAVAYHRRGDAAMVARLEEADLSEMRFRDKVAEALKIRVGAMDNREAVRRASTFFALPTNAGDGAKLVWETADHVWNALGDTSQDVNWYSKRATLSGVWASTVLFWLGDESEGATETLSFIDRRIDDVMQFEKVKAQMRKNPVTKPLMAALGSLARNVRAPVSSRFDDLPGRWTPPS